MRSTQKKTCCAVVFLGLLASLLSVAALILFASRFFIPFLDKATRSIDAEPTGTAYFQDTGGLDYRRIALIEPYQAISSDGRTWFINLKGYSAGLSISNIAELDVIDESTVAVHSHFTSPTVTTVRELWYVILPKERVEEMLTSESEFLTYLKEKGISQPHLTDANELYRELTSAGYLDWYPDEYRTKK